MGARVRSFRQFFSRTFSAFGRFPGGVKLAENVSSFFVFRHVFSRHHDVFLGFRVEHVLELVFLEILLYVPAPIFIFFLCHFIMAWTAIHRISVSSRAFPELARLANPAFFIRRAASAVHAVLFSDKPASHVNAPGRAECLT